MTKPVHTETEAHTEASVAAARGFASERVGFKKVLVGVDGTSTGRDAIALGDLLLDADGHMTLAHVVVAQSPTYRNFDSTPRGREVREMLAREREAAGVCAGLTGMFAPSVGSGLHQLAEDCDADLLVVGSCRRGSVGRLIRGDDTQGSLNDAAGAVAVAPLDYAVGDKRIETIGVAYNSSPESDIALDAARHLAARQGAAVRAVTVVSPTAALVWPKPGSQSAGAGNTKTFESFEREASERLSSLTGIDGTVAVGPLADELLKFSDQVDLMVVGTRGHGPLRRVLHGSTSADLAGSARCPVLVLPRRSEPSHEQPER